MGIAAASAYTKTKHIIRGNILHVCPEGKVKQCSPHNEEMSIQHGKNINQQSLLNIKYVKEKVFDSQFCLETRAV